MKEQNKKPSLFLRETTLASHPCRTGCSGRIFRIALESKRAFSSRCRSRGQAVWPLHGWFRKQPPIHRLRSCGVPKLPRNEHQHYQESVKWVRQPCRIPFYSRLILVRGVHGVKTDVWHIRNTADNRQVSRRWADQWLSSFFRLQFHPWTDGRYCVLCQYLPSFLCACVWDMEALFACKEGFHIRVEHIRNVVVLFDAFLENSLIQSRWRAILDKGRFLQSKDGTRFISASSLSSALSVARSNAGSVTLGIKKAIAQLKR